MQAEQKHPADELAKSLARANGILTLLSGCYERENEGFATGMSYIHESLVAVEQILTKANEALGRLYQMCDLTILRQPTPAVEEPAQVEPVSVVAEPLPLPRMAAAKTPTESYLGLFGPTDGSGMLSERLDDVLTTSSRQQVAVDEAESRPAMTYDELLAKITAVADKAAYRAHQSTSESSLIPELEELRADLIKLRRVA